jgi:hypothetical protein
MRRLKHELVRRNISAAAVFGPRTLYRRFESKDEVVRSGSLISKQRASAALGHSIIALNRQSMSLTHFFTHRLMVSNASVVGFQLYPPAHRARRLPLPSGAIARKAQGDAQEARSQSAEATGCFHRPVCKLGPHK